MAHSLQRFGECGKEIGDALPRFSLDIVHIVASYLWYGSITLKNNYNYTRDIRLRSEDPIMSMTIDNLKEMIWVVQYFNLYGYSLNGPFQSKIEFEKDKKHGYIECLVISPKGHKFAFIPNFPYGRNDVFQVNFSNKQTQTFYKSMNHNLTAMAAHPTQELIIVAGENRAKDENEVLVLKEDGQVTRSFPIAFSPRFLAIHGNELFIAFPDKTYIEVMNMQGKWQQMIYDVKINDIPIHIACDPFGNLFVLYDEQIIVYSPNGTQLTQFPFFNGKKICFDEQARLYIACLKLGLIYTLHFL